MGFTPYLDYKLTKANHADSPGVYTSDKILNLSTIDKIKLKCDAIDGSVVNGLRQTILYILYQINQADSKYFANRKQFTMKK